MISRSFFVSFHDFNFEWFEDIYFYFFSLHFDSTCWFFHSHHTYIVLRSRRGSTGRHFMYVWSARLPSGEVSRGGWDSQWRWHGPPTPSQGKSCPCGISSPCVNMSRRVACLFSEVLDLFDDASLPGRGSYLALSCRGTDRPARTSPRGTRHTAYLPDVELMGGTPDSAKYVIMHSLYLSTIS